MDNPSSGDFLMSENPRRLQESNSACNNDVDVETTKNLIDGWKNIANGSDKEESLEDKNSVERIHVYRRSSMSKERMKTNPIDSLGKSTDDSCSPDMNGKDQDDSAVTAEHLGVKNK